MSFSLLRTRAALLPRIYASHESFSSQGTYSRHRNWITCRETQITGASNVNKPAIRNEKLSVILSLDCEACLEHAAGQSKETCESNEGSRVQKVNESQYAHGSKQ